MKTNHILIIFGLLIFMIGLYRENPVRLDKEFLAANGPTFGFLIILFVVIWKAGGFGLIEEGLIKSIGVTAKFFPLLFMIMLVFGFSFVIINLYRDQLHWLLLKGSYPGAFIIALLAPTLAGFAKFIDEMWSEPQLRYLLLFILTAIPLMSFPIFFFRKMGLGETVAWTMYKTNIQVVILTIPYFFIRSKMALNGWI